MSRLAPEGAHGVVDSEYETKLRPAIHRSYYKSKQCHVDNDTMTLPSLAGVVPSGRGFSTSSKAALSSGSRLGSEYDRRGLNCVRQTHAAKQRRGDNDELLFSLNGNQAAHQAKRCGMAIDDTVTAAIRDRAL